MIGIIIQIPTFAMQPLKYSVLKERLTWRKRALRMMQPSHRPSKLKGKMM